MDMFHHLVGQDTPHMAWWQMTIRAGIIFLYALVLYRLAPRRSFANLSAQDLVLTVILGSCLSRALTGNAPLLPTLVATAALVVLHAAVSALAPRSEMISCLVKGRPIRLIWQGAVDWEAVRHSGLGPRDLNEELRLKGVTRVEDVAEAHLERNGALSVIASRPGRASGPHASEK